MLNVNFINSGSDEALLKAMSKDEYREYDQDELEKAMNRQGLVQKEVTVQGKHGQFTRKQWVKASEDKGSDKSLKANNDGSNKDNYKTDGSTPVDVSKFKFTNYLNPDGQNRPGYGTYREALESVAKETEEKFTHVLSSYWGNMPPAEQLAINFRSLNGSHAYRDMISSISEQGAKDAQNAIYSRQKYLIEQAKQYTKWDTSKRKWVKDSETKGSGKGSKGQGGSVASSKKPPHQITGNSFSALLKNAKDAGFEIDPSDSYDIEHSKRPPKEVTLYSGDKTYSATFNRYSDGGCEFISLKTVQGGTTNETSKVPNTNSTKVTDFLSSRGSDVQANKAGLKQLVSSGESRDSIMAAAKAQGISWKEHANPGINWMRASMAITGTTARGSKSQDGGEFNRTKGSKLTPKFE